MTNVAKKEKIDLSGHVCFDSTLSGWHTEHNRQRDMLDVKRKSGLLNETRDRNPILAEKSARHGFRPFDFNPPPAPEQHEKWNYPDSDWGLLSKLGTQKKLYADIDAQKRHYEEQVAEAKKKISELSSSSSCRSQISESARMMDSQRSYGDTNRSDQQSSTSRATGREDTSLLKTIREEENSLLKTNRQNAEKQKNDINHLNFSNSMKSIKQLNNDHPEILEKLRAERAAEYIKTQKHPKEAPTPRELAHGNFKPPGSFPSSFETKNIFEQNFEGNKKASKTKDLNSARNMKESLGTLMNALLKTEEEIKRQELKIGLGAKTTRGYELPSSARHSKNNLSRYDLTKSP